MSWRTFCLSSTTGSCGDHSWTSGTEPVRLWTKIPLTIDVPYVVDVEILWLNGNLRLGEISNLEIRNPEEGVGTEEVLTVGPEHLPDLNITLTSVVVKDLGITIEEEEVYVTEPERLLELETTFRPVGIQNLGVSLDLEEVLIPKEVSEPKVIVVSEEVQGLKEVIDSEEATNPEVSVDS